MDLSAAKMEGGRPQRRSCSSGQTAAISPSSLRHCSYPAPVAAPNSIHSGSKSLRHSSKSKYKSEPPRPPALTRVKGKITMETPTRMGADMSWLKDATPMDNTPRTPQRSRTHTPEPNSSFVNPSSALLQDLLKEQRATRGSRTGGPEDLENSPQRTPDRGQSQSRSLPQFQTRSQIHSHEEQGSEKQQSKMSSSGSVRRPPEMGVRETDQYISKISKQNFDLKLEIFHRAQQLAHLEKKLEHMQVLEDELERLRGVDEEVQELRAAEEDNQRLRESNEQLRHEIDKRDQAVTEAVELICALEGKVEELTTGKPAPRTSTFNLPYDDGPGISTPRNGSALDIHDIPERTSSRRSMRMAERRRVSSGSRILQRAPSFLLEESQNTAVLRSVYTDLEETVSPKLASPAAMTKSESMNSIAETIEQGSPRLSALSECSELNISEAPMPDEDFDQTDIPIREETNGPSESLSTISLGFSNRELVRVGQWKDNDSKETITKIKTQHLSDIFKQPESSSPSSSFNSSSKTSKPDSVFEGSRLPPTPDTMTTAYPAWANGSSTSTVADKSQHDLRRYLTRTRSADELTTRRSSLNSEPRESMDTDLSKIALPRPSLDERDEDPAFYPLNSIETRYGKIPASREVLTGDFDRVLARMDKDYYSPSRRTSRDETASLGSTPPSLTAEDWIEAARPSTRNRAGPLPANSRLVGARAPSQSSFLGRRHSIDSAVREPTLPVIQTLNLRALDDDSAGPTTTEPEPEPRRRISLLPPFFSRSANARRLQPSPMSDPMDMDDGAPSPVIRKTRNQTAKASQPVSSNSRESFISPSYADDRMSRSFTEANLNSNALTSPTRPTTSNGGKDHHKRRGSLGIFGWMKGASANLGSSLKKSDAAPPLQTASSTSAKADTAPTPSPATAMPASTAVRASSRLAAHDNTALPSGPETTDIKTTIKTVETATAVEDFATRTRHPSRSEEPADEHGRRPRYMERRSRRT
ncbi:uncharacterized protein BDV14DRAFT_173733 [Aspergillus stella-maris]|uniref:uncharacterized protein n=1 Tax=Aspergillus stella-maris TaxID=1810926 RepID=UPI003CCDBAA7